MLAVAVVLSLGVAACGSDQDPGVVTPGSSGGPTTTSHLVQPCPNGRPDASTPPEGCLGKDGTLLH